MLQKALSRSFICEDATIQPKPTLLILSPAYVSNLCFQEKINISLFQSAIRDSITLDIHFFKKSVLFFTLCLLCSCLAISAHSFSLMLASKLFEVRCGLLFWVLLVSTFQIIYHIMEKRFIITL